MVEKTEVEKVCGEKRGELSPNVVCIGLVRKLISYKSVRLI